MKESLRISVLLNLLVGIMEGFKNLKRVNS